MWIWYFSWTQDVCCLVGSYQMLSLTFKGTVIGPCENFLSVARTSVKWEWYMGGEKNTSPCAPCLLILYNKTWVGTSSTSLMHYFTFIRTPFTGRNPAEETYEKDGGQIGQQEERYRGWHKLGATYFTFACQCLVRFWNKRKPFKWVVHSRAKQ